MKNNIFKYATSELSQDAVICWCINWINDKTSSLYPMAVEILQLFGVKENLNDIEIDIFQQRFKIDVLLSLKGRNKIIIIEDKTYTSEHHDQINKYRQEIINMPENAKKEYGIDDDVEITTVYFKTGFLYDYDKKVKADVVIPGEDIIAIIENYIGKSEILDSYYEYIKEGLDWYRVYGKYDNIGEEENFWNWNISRHQIAQYRMMRDIFPEAEWDKTSNFYEVRHGSNVGGRPWTELDIMNGLVGDGNDIYTIFWRIDTDTEGPYISLRLYDRYDKKDASEKQEHINIYNKHRNQIEKIIKAENMIEWEWDTLKGGYTANYYEATLMTFHLKEALKNWDAESAKVIQTVRKITECFVSL